ncbi:MULTISPECIES: hypothetical protein [unclassified Pseudodesulfovibrio]|uniref:hypothetical protein n=1 Tax=unclassified Pseudodesulfovibrio TaxID=2661612 RepID=UPI000FEB7373|nr:MULTISPECIES: hypothetical protein [unclassified Pseudodesulfovibrio]MCJ2163556.1 hypothetical protein [Pseudodesulfovibrio sp. S3-i]RWU06791.1 hypothetical protein DWB63_03230 [Pseudodesulfovibrio sp. S3]
MKTKNFIPLFLGILLMTAVFYGCSSKIPAFDPSSICSQQVAPLAPKAAHMMNAGEHRLYAELDCNIGQMKGGKEFLLTIQEEVEARDEVPADYMTEFYDLNKLIVEADGKFDGVLAKVDPEWMRTLKANYAK